MKKNTKYYVQVWNGKEWRYVTGNDWETKQAFWEEDKPALAFTKSGAEDLAFGLTVNCYRCQVAHNPYLPPEEWHN
jgi:hypothetical protein